jgi:hypothetical protein
MEDRRSEGGDWKNRLLLKLRSENHEEDKAKKKDVSEAGPVSVFS